MCQVAEAAVKLHEEWGFALIPIKPKSKIPYDKGWPSLRLDSEELRQVFEKKPGANLSFLPGSPSGNIVDIDLDAWEAVELAREFLPATGFVFGRAGKPASHWLYRVSGTYKTAKYTDPEREVQGENGMLVEFRADGAQTVLPPSTHVSGEQIRWEYFEGPAELEAEALIMAVARLAAASLLTRYWPKQGIRQQLSLALAGGLLRDGMEDHEVEHFITAVARAAEDEEAETRANVVAGTVAKVVGGENVTGWPTVSNLLGEKVASRLHDFIVQSLPPREGKHGEDGRKVVYVDNEDLVSVTREAWEAVDGWNNPPVLFKHIGGELVRLVRSNQDLTIEPLNTESMRFHLAHAAMWLKRMREGDKITYPTTIICNAMLHDPDPVLPTLRRIVKMPTYGESGELHKEAGYNTKTGTYYDPLYHLDVSDVPEEPSEGMVEWAKETIATEMLGDFPFVDDADRHNAYSLVILPFVRDMVDGPTPMYLWEAPEPGTGKSLAAQVTLVPAIGKDVGMMTETETEDEWRKRILAALREHQEVIFLDNVNKMLTSSSLASVVTATTFTDRVLGMSKSISIPVRSIWVVTANNPTLTTEFARRCVQIRLDAKVDRPWLRQGFRHTDIMEWTIANRAELVKAALILVNNWLAKGRPKGNVNMGSFESWARVVGGIMAAAGWDSFLGNMMNLYDSADVEGNAWREFVSLWLADYGEAEVGVSELFEQALKVDDLYTGKGGLTDRKFFGRILGKQKGRVINGYQIVKSRTVKNTNKYRLAKVA